MAGFTSVMTGLSMVGNLVGGFAGDRADNRAYIDQQNANFAYAQQQAAHQRAELEQRAAADEESRQSALKRAVARQKSLYGSGGIASGDGSARAVLLGLFEESEDEKMRRENLDRLRYSAIDSELGHRRTVNMLNVSAAKERNKIATITGLDKAAGTTAKLIG